MLPGLTLGDQLTRQEIHARYGGRIQGSISPSRHAPVVLFFIDASNGLDDTAYGWDDEGYFHCVGEGRFSDQRLTQGNKAILNHQADGRTLEVFQKHGKDYTYLGEFALADHYFADGPSLDDMSTSRQLVIFRLHPLSEPPVKFPMLPITPKNQARVEPYALTHEAPSPHLPARTQSIATESELVRKYAQHLQRQGHTVGRIRLIPPGETVSFYSDLWDDSTKDLIEAKGSVSRSVVRTAVGQLLDYRRFVEANRLTVLVPSRPRIDIVDFLRSVGVEVVYPDGEEWIRLNSPGGDTPEKTART